MRILIVDTAPLLAHMLKGFLLDLSQEVAVVPSAKDLLEGKAPAVGAPDVIISGSNGSGTHNRAVLEKLHATFANSKTVLLIRGEPAFSTADGIRCGIYAYLREPIYLCELELMLQRLRPPPATGKEE